MKHRWWKWPARIVVSLALPVLLLSIAELGLRIAGVGYDPNFWIGIEGRNSLTTNDRFGWRFFPRTLARTPAPEVLESVKPRNTRRVFVLGESAAMGFPEPAFGVSRMLEVFLSHQYPDVRWEVRNAAMTAINSHAIVEIASDCARRQPDVFVVVMGNNEVIGPYGPATAFGGAGLPLPFIRLSVRQSATRVGQALASVLRDRRYTGTEWRGMEMFLEQQVPASSPALESTYRNFRENLRDIVNQGLSTGAAVVVATVPVNLRDCPPFASQDGEAADHYRRAQALQTSGDSERAAALLRSARDLDTLRFRADSKLNQIVRDVAVSVQGPRVALADAERSFGIAGKDMFYEHVHFTPVGNYRLAAELAAAIQRVAPGASGQPPVFEQVRNELALTSWDEQQMRAQIAALMERPPFTGQPGNERRRSRLLASEDPASLRARARPIYEAAIEARPEDLHLRMRYAQLLRDSGAPAEAAEQWTKLIDQVPGRATWHAARGAALSDGGNQSEATAEFQQALRLDPDSDLALFGMGVAKAREGDRNEAIGYYEAALRKNPSYAEAAFNLAAVLSLSGRTIEADAALRRALAARPGYAEAHAALAQSLAGQGKTIEAIEHYRSALKARPDLAEAHYDVGVLLAREGRYDEAIAEYKAAIESRPAYAEAYNNLGTTLARKGDYRGAAEAFRKAIDIQPAYQAALANLQRARLRQESSGGTLP